MTVVHASLAQKAMSESPAPSDRYFLHREHWSSVRLHAQHLFFTTHLGYVLHPEITRQLPADARVCDIGTGTGVFVLDLAHHLPPSATLDGFDISSDQFPSQDWLPPNVHFSTLDILEPLARPELREQYDVICLRMLVSVIPDEPTFGVVMRNLRAMLKPGGFIQWSELDVCNIKSAAASSSVSTVAIQRYTDVMVAAMAAQADITWVNRMDQVFCKHGVDVKSFSQFPLRPELRSAWSSNLLCAYDESRPNASPGLEPADLARSASLQKLSSEAGMEARRGAFLQSEFFVCIGQKSTSDRLPESQRW